MRIEGYPFPSPSLGYQYSRQKLFLLFFNIFFLYPLFVYLILKSIFFFLFVKAFDDGHDFCLCKDKVLLSSLSFWVTFILSLLFCLFI